MNNKSPYAAAAQAIAKALGEAWEYRPDAWDDDGLKTNDRAFYLHNNSTGLTLYARKDWNNKTKFTFSGSYPGHTSYTTDPSVGVSITRTAANIAADLKRRLIPEAQKLHEERFAKEAQKDATKARQYDMAQQIALALDGTEPATPRHGRSQSALATGIGGYPVLTAAFTVDFYTHDNEVTINLQADRIPLDAALQIATILRGARLASKVNHGVG